MWDLGEVTAGLHLVWKSSCAVKKNGHIGTAGSSFGTEDACVNGSLQSDDKRYLNFWNQL